MGEPEINIILQIKV